MAMTKEERAKLTVEELCDQIDEEASEVIKASCKLRRFGPRPKVGDIQYDNVHDLLTEFQQLRGFVQELSKRLKAAPVRQKRRKSNRKPAGRWDRADPIPT